METKIDKIKIELNDLKMIGLKINEVHEQTQFLMNRIVELEVLLHGKFRLDDE